MNIKITFAVSRKGRLDLITKNIPQKGDIYKKISDAKRDLERQGYSVRDWYQN